LLNLIWFHRVLIVCAVIFCASFAVYEFMRYQGAGGMAKLILAIVFAIFAIALSWYLKNLDRFLNVGNRSK
jgi:hypothetical protein